jgi:hypothetical protein
LTADFPEKVASISGNGEISTYAIPTMTAREITDLSVVDTQPYYPISSTVKSIYAGFRRNRIPG